jgi:succinate dehydrogenase / fumarate reductase membrane anchor subunit
MSLSDRASATRGTHHWWAQRVSAIALVALSVWLVIALLSMSELDYEAVRAWLNRGWNALLMVALVLVGAQHSYLGLRVVAEDYVSHGSRRIAILLALRFAHTILAAAAVFAVFEVAFGAVP